jgi:hypothetical protein
MSQREKKDESGEMSRGRPRVMQTSPLSGLGIGAVIVVVIAVLLLRASGGIVGGAKQSQSPDASVGSQPQGSSAAMTSPGTVPTSDPSVMPDGTLTGDVPAPNATVPAQVPVIAGLRIESVVGLWQSLGLECKSYLGAFPGTPGGYSLECEHRDTAANVDVVAEAAYWTSEGVQAISISATSINGQAIDGNATATSWLVPTLRLAGGDTATTWLQAHMGPTTCRDDCAGIFGGGRISFSVGNLGGQNLHIEAAMPPTQ